MAGGVAVHVMTPSPLQPYHSQCMWTEYEYLAGSVHTQLAVYCVLHAHPHTAIITLVQSHTLSLFILFSMDYT